jgi:hypothetical protein
MKNRSRNEEKTQEKKFGIAQANGPDWVKTEHRYLTLAGRKED